MRSTSVGKKGPGDGLRYAVVLTLLNLLLWFGILFNLPGTWPMILFPAILEWVQPGQFMFSWTVLFVALGCAVLGEGLELALGAAGSHQAGGSKRAAALAIGGGFIGGIVGTALPVPLFGALIGACLGAFIGALIGDLWSGRTLPQSIETGCGAAVGRLSGTVAKLLLAQSLWSFWRSPPSSEGAEGWAKEERQCP